MSIRDAIKDFFKETSNKIVVTVSSALIIAVITGLYKNKKDYLVSVKDFLVDNWVWILSFAIVVGVVTYIFVQIKSVKETLEQKLKILSQPASHLSEATASYTEIKKTVSSLKERMYSIEDDIYRLKRSDLYNRAKEHQMLGQKGALLCRLDVVTLDIENGNEYNLEESLEELFGFARSYEAFGPQDLSETKNVLSKVKNDGHKEIVEQILNQIRIKLGTRS